MSKLWFCFLIFSQLFWCLYAIRLPKWCSGKESAYQCRRCKRWGFHPWVRKIHWSRKWQPTPVCLPGKSGVAESDMTEHACRDFLNFQKLTLLIDSDPNIGICQYASKHWPISIHCQYQYILNDTSWY